MYDSLVAKITAAALAGFTSLALLAGVDTLAVQQHAGTALAQGHQTPAMVAAAASAVEDARI